MGDYRVASVASHLFYVKSSCSFNASCKTFEKLMLCFSASFASYAFSISVDFSVKIVYNLRKITKNRKIGRRK